MKQFKGQWLAIMSTILIVVICMAKCSAPAHAADAHQGFEKVEVMTTQVKIESMREFLSAAEGMVEEESQQGELAREAINVLYDYFSLDLPEIVVERMVFSKEK